MNRRIAHAAVAATAAVALTAAPAVTASAQESLPAQTQDSRGDTYYLNREGTYYVRTLPEAAKPYAQLDSAQQEKAVAVLQMRKRRPMGGVFVPARVRLRDCASAGPVSRHAGGTATARAAPGWADDRSSIPCE